MTSSNPAVDLIKQLSELRLRLSSEDSGSRKEALQLSKKLTASLEKPEDVSVALAFSPIIPVTARIAVHLNLFKHIVNHGAPISSVELAVFSGGEELLIIRVLRSVSSIGLVYEVGERLWKANHITKVMALEGIAAGHTMLGEMVAGAAQKATKYLKEAGYKCPTDPKDGLMQYVTPQPLKGARGISIIISSTTGQMSNAKKSSRRQGASTFHAMLDMTKMAFNSGMERIERQWRELLKGSGFEVLKIWPPLEEDADGIVEAVLKG